MSSTESTQERRRFTRIQFDAETRISVANQSIDVQLMDISFKGLLLSSDTDLPCSVGDTCTIQVTLGENLLEFPAVLTHKKDSHYGFRTDQLDIDTATHLRRLVELNLGDETLFERELEQLLPPA